MSIAETYLMASKVRTKLDKEAAKSDPNIRMLVSHANILDQLLSTIEEHKSTQRELRSKLTSKSVVKFQEVPSYVYNSEITTTTTTTYVDDDSSDSSDSDDDDWDDESDEEFEITEDDTEVSSISYEIDEDEEEEEEEEEEEYVQKPFQLPTFSNFRTLPTIDELSEEELQTIEDDLTDSESESEGEGEMEEADIVDMVRTTSPPQLSYSSTDDSESESENEDEVYEQHSNKNQYSEQSLFNKPLLNNQTIIDVSTIEQ